MTHSIRSNFFNEAELSEIKEVISYELSTREVVMWDDQKMGNKNEDNIIQIKGNGLGRLDMVNLPLSECIKEKVWLAAQEMYQLKESSPVVLTNVTYAEYSLNYGDPKLSVHLDNGHCGLIMDYQLESNTSWPIGIEKDLVDIRDNDMVAIYPLTEYHWRPNKIWEKDHFVKLILFDFFTPGIKILNDEERKKEVITFMDSITVGETDEA